MPRGENEMVLRRTYLGKMVILGLRPEDLQDEITASAHRICYKENQLKAFVDLREMIGAEAYLHMNPEKILITARVPSEVPVTARKALHCMQIWKKHRSLIRLQKKIFYLGRLKKKNVQQHKKVAESEKSNRKV